MNLYDYQLDLKTQIYNSWAIGYKNVCAVMPTGAGKSVVVSDIVLDGCKTKLKQVVVAHRNELVQQMSCHIAARGIQHRIVGSASTVSQIVRKHHALFNKSFVNPTASTAVVGVDTLMSRQDDLAAWARQIDRWVIDETHHLVAENKWGKAVQLFSNAHGLGVTATPARADGQGLGRVFDGYMDILVNGPSMRFLIKEGFLSDYEIVCPRSDISIDDLEVSRDGDWSSKKLKKAAKKSHIVGDVVENYRRYADGRKAIVFATDVETAGDIAEKFNANGYKAAALSAVTPTAYREQCTQEFARGSLQVLVNVDLFDEGFDVPACDVCIMARPTASLPKYLQMVGRCLRFVKGKTALIIDHVSNVIRHGLPDTRREWSLARRDKRAKQTKDPDEIPLTVCQKCLKPYEAFRTCCPYCGFERPLPDGGSRSVEMVQGDLVLLNKEMLEQMRIATVLESPGDIAKRVSAVAGLIAGKGAANRQIEKIEAHGTLYKNIAQWVAVERAKGYNDREIHRRFYMTAGTDVLSALNAGRSRADFELTNQLVESWLS